MRGGKEVTLLETGRHPRSPNEISKIEVCSDLECCESIFQVPLVPGVVSIEKCDGINLCCERVQRAVSRGGDAAVLLLDQVNSLAILCGKCLQL